MKSISLQIHLHSPRHQLRWERLERGKKRKNDRQQFLTAAIKGFGYQKIAFFQSHLTRVKKICFLTVHIFPQNQIKTKFFCYFNMHYIFANSLTKNAEKCSVSKLLFSIAFALVFAYDFWFFLLPKLPSHSSDKVFFFLFQTPFLPLN